MSSRVNRSVELEADRVVLWLRDDLRGMLNDLDCIVLSPGPGRPDIPSVSLSVTPGSMIIRLLNFKRLWSRCV